MKNNKQKALEKIRNACILNWETSNAIDGLGVVTWSDLRTGKVRAYLENTLQRIFAVPIKNAILHEIYEPNFRMSFLRFVTFS